ncbi:MAG: hypothetical protein NZ730_06080 [Porticoccaceae bacterium]|nr:hypothetical protein [Porticoccaceae bacterium]
MRDYAPLHNKYAEWGCSWQSHKVSVDYAPVEWRLVNQLHETLHLLGVDDCYNNAEPGEGKPPQQTIINEGRFGSWLVRYRNALSNGNLVVSSTPQGDLEADSLFVALGLD